MRRLFRRSLPAPDNRPALLSVISMMVLLVPMLILTSSLERYTGLKLGVPGPSETLPPEPPGAVEYLRVAASPGGFVVTAAVRNTDVLAGAGDTEQRELAAADLTELQDVLATLKALDPGRERITLAPGPDTTTDEVVRWMDAVRDGPKGPLFPRVILEAAQ